MKICERIHFIFSNHRLCKNSYNLFSIYFTMFGMHCYKVKLILIVMAHQINQIWDRDPKCLFIFICISCISQPAFDDLCALFWQNECIIFRKSTPTHKKKRATRI